MVVNKIFLGAPFIDYINPETGMLYEDKKNMLVRLIDYFVNKGFVVENSHLREEWGRTWMPSEVCTPLDYEHIKGADVFVAIPGNPPSGGAHIELGWASSLNKRIILLLEKDKNYSNLVLGLNKITSVDYVWYKSLDECIQKLDRLIWHKK